MKEREADSLVVESNINSPGMEIGIYTFGELIKNPLSGFSITAQQRLKEMVAAAKLADELGLDVFGVGEHHRLDFAVSATPVVLAAIAQATAQIRLTSATTVLSTVDPVRLFEDYATLDLLSNGRAELMMGRGAFVESFPLFGYDLNDYRSLYDEKIQLFLQLNQDQIVSWKGRFRSPLTDAQIAPRPLQAKLPVWMGVGRSHESADQAGILGTGITLALLGGNPNDFKPVVDIYRISGRLAGHMPKDLRVAVATHGYVAKTTKQAIEEFYPFYSNYFKNYLKSNRIKEMTKEVFEELVLHEKGLLVGSPDHIIEKILHHYEIFGHQRIMLQMDIGGMPYHQVARSIELLAVEVAPVIRKKTGA
jgi:probable LLM family oxidoreductase